MTLLFSLAQCNGTLDRLAHHAVRTCRGNRGLIPIMFFLLAAALGSIGPGNIATAAILAPMAMATASHVGIPLFLMAIMVGNGSNAGALSPFAPTGIIVNGLMARNQLTGYETQTYLYNLAAHSLVAFGGYFLFGGWKLFARGEAAAVESGAVLAGRSIVAGRSVAAAGRSVAVGGSVAVAGGSTAVGSGTAAAPPGTFEGRHWITLGVIATLILSVLFFDVNVGMGAFLASAVLVLFRAADDGEAGGDAVRR